jgi:hypothetical protein
MSDEKETITPLAFAKKLAADPKFAKAFKAFKKELQEEGSEGILWLLFTCFTFLYDMTGYEYQRDDFDESEVSIDMVMQELENKISFLDKDVTYIKRKIKKLFK